MGQGRRSPSFYIGSATPPYTLVHGQKTIAAAGTEEPIRAFSATTKLAQGITLRALASNTGLVYVGGNPVTSATGYQLKADESVFVPCDDPSKIYIDVQTNGEGVSYVGG